MMQFINWKVAFAVILVVVASIIGIVSIAYLGPDNAVEEEAEAVIKEETGVNVNFTPPKPTEIK